MANAYRVMICDLNLVPQEGHDPSISFEHAILSGTCIPTSTTAASLFSCKLVLEKGYDPSRPFGTLLFENSAATCYATPARYSVVNWCSEGDLNPPRPCGPRFLKPCCLPFHHHCIWRRARNTISMPCGTNGLANHVGTPVRLTLLI